MTLHQFADKHTTTCTTPCTFIHAVLYRNGMFLNICEFFLFMSIIKMSMLVITVVFITMLYYFDNYSINTLYLLRDRVDQRMSGTVNTG